jgi:transcriptional regulator with XRE-family HTH domain
VEDSLQQTVGRSVKAYRQAQGLSQESFAHMIGVHRTYLGGLERGEYNLTLKSVERIAGRIGLQPMALLGVYGRVEQLNVRELGQILTLLACDDRS